MAGCAHCCARHRGARHSDTAERTVGGAALRCAGTVRWRCHATTRALLLQLPFSSFAAPRPKVRATRRCSGQRAVPSRSTEREEGRRAGGGAAAVARLFAPPRPAPPGRCVRGASRLAWCTGRCSSASWNTLAGCSLCSWPHRRPAPFPFSPRFAVQSAAARRSARTQQLLGRRGRTRETGRGACSWWVERWQAGKSAIRSIRMRRA